MLERMLKVLKSGITQVLDVWLTLALTVKSVTKMKSNTAVQASVCTPITQHTGLMNTKAKDKTLLLVATPNILFARKDLL